MLRSHGSLPGRVRQARALKRSTGENAGATVSLLLGKFRDDPPDQVRRDLSRSIGIELIHQLVKALAVGQAVALADVLAKQLAQAIFILRFDCRRTRSGFAQLW